MEVGEVADISTMDWFVLIWDYFQTSTVQLTIYVVVALGLTIYSEPFEQHILVGETGASCKKIQGCSSNCFLIETV